MTTFQAIVYGIVHGFSEFLPVSASAHDLLVSWILDWPVPTAAASGALALGSFLALLIYFRHDWASMISSLLQVILFRRKPMTLDERMPLFIVMAVLPSAAAWLYLRDPVAGLPWNPLWIAASLVLFGLPFWFGDYWSKKNKNMYDWNWFDSLLAGVSQIVIYIPGAGRQGGLIPTALMRNFSREAAAKFSLYVMAPLLLGNAILKLQGVSLKMAEPMPEMSWLSFGVMLLVTLLTGLLAIGGLLKHLGRSHGYGQYVAYRFVIAAGVAGLYWYRTRSG